MPRPQNRPPLQPLLFPFNTTLPDAPLDRPRVRKPLPLIAPLKVKVLPEAQVTSMSLVPPLFKVMLFVRLDTRVGLRLRKVTIAVVGPTITVPWPAVSSPLKRMPPP